MDLTRHNQVPVIALAAGDPAGVGPEICSKAISRLLPRIEAKKLGLVTIGSRQAFKNAEKLTGANHAGIREVTDLSERAESECLMVNVAPDDHPIEPGRVSARAGEIAYLTAVKAVELVQSGVADAIVTAPLNKEAMYLAGHHFAGYTDLLAQLAKTQQAVMMLAHGRLRVSHVTTHVALREVPQLLTPERLERVIRLTHEALGDFDIQRPTIGIAALNPHAGEGRNFGDEDDEIVKPVVAAMRKEGFNVEGPIPGDTIFVKAMGGQFDAVVAMYHDQGHVPVKLLGFKIDEKSGEWVDLSGVNITLGLPFVRTSVDHGTAFDIAGKGVAKEGSLMEAIEIAERLVRGRLTRAKGKVKS